MRLNSLKIATSGYLKRQTKAVLIIAVSGYLNSQVTPTPPVYPPKPQRIMGLGSNILSIPRVDDEREKRIKIEDSEIIVIVELTLKRFII